MIEFLVFFSSVGFVALLVKGNFQSRRIWDLEQRIDLLSRAMMSMHLNEALDELDQMIKTGQDVKESSNE